MLVACLLHAASCSGFTAHAGSLGRVRDKVSFREDTSLQKGKMAAQEIDGSQAEQLSTVSYGQVTSRSKLWQEQGGAVTCLDKR